MYDDFDAQITAEEYYNDDDYQPSPDDEAEYNESMDGDFDSGMASAGFGTDEDYGYYGEDDYDF